MSELHRVLPAGTDVSLVFRAADGGSSVVTRRAKVEHLERGIVLHVDEGTPMDQRYFVTIERPGRLPLPVRTTKIAAAEPDRIVLAP
jgi:hypothetical protein